MFLSIADCLLEFFRRVNLEFVNLCTPNAHPRNSKGEGLNRAPITMKPALMRPTLKIIY